MKISAIQKILIFMLVAMILVVAALIVVILVQDSRSQRPQDLQTSAPIVTTEVTQPATQAKTTEMITTETPTTARATTETVTTAEVTTEKVTTVKVTTAKVTTAKVTTKAVTTAKPVPGIPVTHPTDEYKYEFKTDLSAYEKYMNPTGDDWSDEYLLLVNPQKPLEKGGEDKYPFVAGRVEVGTAGFTFKPTLTVNAVVLKAFEALAKEAKANGIKGIDFSSAYRKYSSQESIFNNNVSKTKKYECVSCGHTYITKASYTKCEACGGSVKSVSITKAEAEANVATYSCRPGTSEHQTGLAADLISTAQDSKYWSLIQEFGDTKEGKWLAENCYKFGFILRFPEDKQEITGIIYEPWHFRFVGRYHATKMHELNMCLEEYIDYLNTNAYFAQ